MPKGHKVTKIAMNVALVTVSTCIAFMTLNFFFPFVFREDVFPRNLVANSDSLQYAYYPNTYNFKGSPTWVAVVGDSFAQGMGDAFLNGDENYSAAHFLHQRTGKNFLIFGKSGFGSLGAAATFIGDFRSYRDSWIYPKLHKPEAIFDFFYAGNDLNNNIEDLNKYMMKNESTKNLVARLIEKRPSKWFIDANLPFASLLYNYVRFNAKKLVHMQMSAPDNAQGRWPNSLTVGGNTISAPPLQSSAAELSEEELQRSLAVLFSSLEYLKRWSPGSEIVVVYIPSVVGSYDWHEPIEIQKYSDNPTKFITNKFDEMKSEEIRYKICQFSNLSDFTFVDTTSYVRKEGRKRLLHGPKDWKHLNKDGYSAVASAIMEQFYENPHHHRNNCHKG